MCCECGHVPCLTGCPNARERARAGTCTDCAQPIYSGEEVVDIDGDLYHLVSFTNPFTGNTVGFNFPSIGKIPYLAQGAVIPPNREFLAVLGDQTSGTNIEAPASLIKQMVEEALAEAGASGEQEITINLTTLLDGEVVYKNQERIKARRGRRVVGNPALL